MASVMSVTNETRSTTSRVTKEGKKLTYEMHVIQQPERARACGQGAKCKSRVISCGIEIISRSIELTFSSICRPSSSRPSPSRRASHL